MDSNLLVKASKPKPLLRLKDYLLDDLNSCSSSGFRTYPRRQCCTTVRFLLEIDMKNKQAMYKKKVSKLIKNGSSSSSTTTTRLSAFQKASEVIFTAVKQFGFTVVKSTTSSSRQTKNIATLSRSLSRKFLKNGFWKKNDQNWKPSTEVNIESLNRTMNSDSNDRIGKRVGVTVGDDRDSMDVTTSTNSSSTNNSTNSKKSCRNEEEKEQFSPVSVLDCPFDDEDEVSSTSSPFRHRLGHVEGTKKKLMKKLRKFERLAQLEPLNLENRLTYDHESIECPHLHSSESSLESFVLNIEDEQEEKPLKLLEFVKATMPSSSFKSKPDNLLLDFFKERLSDNGIEETKGYNDVLSVAKDWINGKYREFSVDWEVKKNRQAFIIDMEKKGEWKKMDEEIKEMAMDLEDEIFGSLLNELMDDMFPGLEIV